MGIFDNFSTQVATLGERLGLPEWGISERISGSPTQTIPNAWNPQGAYQSPVVSQQNAIYNPSTPSVNRTLTRPRGQVLGSNNAPVNTTNPGGGGGGQPTNSEPSIQDLLDQGYGSYLAQLDQMMGGLEPQRVAQQGIVESQYGQGLTNLQGQRESGLYDLAGQRASVQTSQVKSLKDVDTYLRNAFRAGNMYLGARGAADSSAANMYSYALTKLGGQQRADVLSQANTSYQAIADREFKLNNIYNSEVNRLGSEKEQKLMSISQWFSEAQNQIRGLQAGAQREKSQQTLNIALQALNQADTDSRNQRAMLDSWVVTNAKSITEAKAGMASNAQYTAPGISTNPIVGNLTTDAMGNAFQGPSYGYGSNYGQTKYDLYGRPINYA